MAEMDTQTSVRTSEPHAMASAGSPYDQRLRMVDAFQEYKFYFTKAHFLFLVQESLELTRGGAVKLKYILDLASRCKTGVVPIELLAKQIDKEYSLPPFLQEQEGEVDDGRVQESEDMETENAGGGGQEDEELGGEDEEEEPHVNADVKTLIDTFRRSFFAPARWPVVVEPFIVPGERHLLDAHDIEMFRSSASDDLAISTPKTMSACLNAVSRKGKLFDNVVRKQKRGYQLCRKVAVSFDGKIYRATDAEIEFALQHEKDAPSTDAATYLKAVQEVRRQHARARARARRSCSG